jgi:CRISPR/Cas system-associated endonuclease Cas1
MLKPADFYTTDEGGVFLQRRGLAVFFREYTRRLATKVYHPLAQRSISYQKCFEVQARHLRKVIEGEPHYQPMKVK